MADGPIPPFERKAFFASELDRIKFAERCGELIHRFDLEQDLAALCKTAVQCCESLPDVIERDCGVPGPVVEAVEREIDAFRDDVYLHIVGEDAPAAGSVP